MKQLIILLLCCVCNMHAQNTTFGDFAKQKRVEFEEYIQNQRTEFEKYRTLQNKAFANYMAHRWLAFQRFRGVKAPSCPGPVKPIIKCDDGFRSDPVKLSVKNIVAVPSATSDMPLARPIVPTLSGETSFTNEPLSDPEKRNLFCATFYNNRCYVSLMEKHRFVFENTDETTLSTMWNKLSDGRMDEILDNCLSYREKMHLCDYAYVQLIGAVCSSFFGKNSHNEAVFMQFFLLTQSGYDVKCANKNNDLVLMITTDKQLYQMPYLEVNDCVYYLIDDTKEEGEYRTFPQKFSNQSQCCSMMITDRMEFPEKKLSDVRYLKAKGYPKLKVKTRVDKNLMDFYTNYPHCAWEIYANTPMSEILADTLLPVLRRSVDGRSEEKMANMLINFVETAFEYMDDGKQFGYERPFFVDETFFYPYSDCEDRAILFSYLMRKLLHLDVVLLHYPNHLATAVNFHSDVRGDYVIVDEKKYIVCDPTYIGADIGESMPGFRNTEVEVIKF